MVFLRNGLRNVGGGLGVPVSHTLSPSRGAWADLWTTTQKQDLFILQNILFDAINKQIPHKKEAMHHFLSLDPLFILLDLLFRYKYK